MKKRRSITIALILSTLLVACGTENTENEPVEPEETIEEPVEESEDTTQTDEEEVGEVTEVEAEEPEEDKEEEADEMETVTSGEISEAYTADQTSATEPVPLGEWGQITSYSTEDSQYHPTYLRITQITSESENPEYIQSAFAEHNDLAENDFQEINPDEVDLPSDVEWLIVDYEIYYPEDFPAGEFGISEGNIYLSAKNPEGGGIPSQDGTATYLSLGSPEKLFVDTIENSQPGDTRKNRHVHTMVKEYEDFIFELQSSLGDGEEFENIFYGSK